MTIIIKNQEVEVTPQNIEWAYENGYISDVNVSEYMDYLSDCRHNFGPEEDAAYGRLQDLIN